MSPIRSFCVASLWALGACARPPSPAGPQTETAALACLHAAYTEGARLAPCVDSSVAPQAELLARMDRLRALQEGHPSAVTDDGWRALLSDLDSVSTPAATLQRWSAARARLGTGRCAPAPGEGVEIARHFRAISRPVEGWPPVAEATRASLSTKLATLEGRAYRCDGGGVIRVLSVARGAARVLVQVE